MDPNVSILITTVDDGPIDRYGSQESNALYLTNHGIDATRSVRVAGFTEGRDNFCRYKVVEPHDIGKLEITGVGEYDALVTTDAKVTLFIPLADCVGAVLYDPTRHALMLSHLGRQSIEEYGGRKSVQFLIDQCGSHAKDIEVFLGPAPVKAQYPLFAFEGRSLQEEATRQLIEIGVLEEHIKCDARNTATDEHLYSHSEFLKGHRPLDGRYLFAVSMQD